jgi:hypothetical protein
VTDRGSLFGYRVQSELPLPRLRPGSHAGDTIDVRTAPGPLATGAGREIGRLDYPDGSPLFTIAEDDEGFVAWCAVSGTFRVQPELGLVTTDAEEASTFWQDRLTNAIVPLLLSARGELMLHAAAASDSDGAILLCGISGRGKSTLVDALGRRGTDVLAEDGVRLSFDGDAVSAWPGPLGVRLRAPDGAGVKAVHHHPAGGKGAGPVPVAGIGVLAPREGERAEIRPMGVEEALAPIFSHAILARPALRQAVFSQVASLLARVPAYAIRVPDDLARLDEAAAAVWDRLR